MKGAHISKKTQRRLTGKSLTRVHQLQIHELVALIKIGNKSAKKELVRRCS